MKRLRALLAATALVAAGLLAAPANAPAAAAWTGTWSTSPQNGGRTFNQQTLRQIVHTSIGGTAARIQLSNVFSTQLLQSLKDGRLGARVKPMSVKLAWGHWP
jgi:hypothetical protein